MSFPDTGRFVRVRVRRERGHAANPWVAQPFAIVSHALLRGEAYAAPLRALLTSEGAAGTVLILDESHHAAPASSGKYAVDSRFTRMVRDMAPLFEHRMFLSATPHNGHSNSFSALLEIIDPARFVRGIQPAPEDRRAIVIRRLKRDLSDELLDEYPKRTVVQHTITGLPSDAPEIALSRLLDRHRELREARLERTLRVHRRAQADDTAVLRMARDAFASPQRALGEDWAKKNVIAYIPTWLSGLTPVLAARVEAAYGVRSGRREPVAMIYLRTESG